jgi:hypothetical protein
MPFPKYWNPGMGGLVQDQPTRLRLPIPGYKDPYTGMGKGLKNYPQNGQGQVMPSVVNGAVSIPRPSEFINPPVGQYSTIGGIMRPTGIIAREIPAPVPIPESPDTRTRHHGERRARGNHAVHADYL